MKINAIAFQQHGGPEVFEETTVELPDNPAPGHVRVRVDAVALNHLDLWFRRGLPHLKLQMPHRLGSDVAGRVEALGEGAKAPPPGTEVVLAPGAACGVCEPCVNGDDNQCRDFKILGEFIPGGYQELVDIPAANVFVKPAKLSAAEAASIPLTFLTAWALVIQKGQVQVGETVLIHAAGSGVSTAAIQLAKLSGAKVIATSSKGWKAAQAKELGADEVIDTSAADWVNEVKRLTGKRGVDLAVDHVGGELFEKSMTVLATNGRIATCGATSGPIKGFDLNRAFMRFNTVYGTRMGPKRFLWPILKEVERGKLRPVVHKTFPLTAEGAREAHRLLEAREAFGKVVLSGR